MDTNSFTIESIDKSVISLEKEIKAKQDAINCLNKAKNELLKVSDVCTVCYGKKEIYEPCTDHGDPYHKSSDDWVKCYKCNGSGKYTV